MTRNCQNDRLSANPQQHPDITSHPTADMCTTVFHIRPPTVFRQEFTPPPAHPYTGMATAPPPPYSDSRQRLSTMGLRQFRSPNHFDVGKGTSPADLRQPASRILLTPLRPHIYNIRYGHKTKVRPYGRTPINIANLSRYSAMGVTLT